MKEFDELVKADKVSIVEKEARKELKHLGRVRVYRGQKFWELNLKTLDIKPVSVETVVSITGEVARKYVVKENCWYAVAINKENAERKFLQKLKRLNEPNRDI